MLDLFAASECVLVLTHGVIVQTDVDCGASCPACELGRSCLVQEDCASPNLCNLGVCQPLGGGGDGPAASCLDQTKNQLESDVDCGGPCSPCGAGKTCDRDSDCQSSVCTEGVCAAASCSDGVKNGAERDIDCGDGVCPGCAVGKACIAGFGCTSGVCGNDGLCAQATCTDGVRNGDESDIDCGSAASGCGLCKVGAMCGADATVCESGICVDGVCDSPSCVDGLHNGREKATDCGQVACAVGCPANSDCDTDADCLSKVCRLGVCLAPTCSDLVQNGDETSQDCGGSCSQCGPGSACSQGADCSTGVCVGGMCLPASCEDGVLNGYEIAVDCGGPDCDGCPVATACTNNFDCASGICFKAAGAATGACTAPTCTDAVMNGMETAVDCGGGVCSRCPVDAGCSTGDDCVTRVCDSEGTNVCLAATCTDGVANGDETDTDCGGSCSSKCANLLLCVENTDCASGVCRLGVCSQPSCSDGVKNQDETDIDCGGPTCQSCGVGQTCSGATDCSSGACESNVCVALASCSDGETNGDESGPDCGGSCSAKCSLGVACNKHSDCLSKSCAAGVCVAASCSDGLKNQDETSVDCGGSCKKCPTGSACLAGSDCRQGVCVGGTCAARTCSDLVKNGDESAVDCGGSCAPCATGVSGCVSNLDCQSGSCVGSVCAAPSCSDGVKNGLESGTDCGSGSGCGLCPVGQACVLDTDCTSNTCALGVCTAATTCDGSVCGGECPPCDDGASGCSTGVDCASGVCKDSVCVAPTCTDGVRNGAEGGVDCGGSSSCPRCAGGSECSKDSDCADRNCKGGKCLAASCSDGRVNGAETGVDCGGDCPNGCSTGVSCSAGDDCASKVCSSGVCIPPTCNDNVMNGQETCIDGGGSVCSGCAAGDTCSSHNDCASGVCTGGVCGAADTCSNGVKDGSETAVDCGGSCAACAVDVECTAHAQCASKICMNNKCAAPTCSDGVSNGDEVGVDCGGQTCDSCATGTVCLVNSDCLSGVCVVSTGKCGSGSSCSNGVKDEFEEDIDCGGVCDPCTTTFVPGAWCHDGVLNGDESDVDCGGSCSNCGGGSTCFSGLDCVSSTCVLGKCDVPNHCTNGEVDNDETGVDCGGNCEPCSVAGSGCTSGSDCASGVCVASNNGGACAAASCTDLVKNGDESDIDCGGSCQTKCGASLKCDADSDCQSGSCSTTNGRCNAPNTCADGVQNFGETCIDGGGPCSPCRLAEGCAITADCESGLVCSFGVCAFSAGGGFPGIAALTGSGSGTGTGTGSSSGSTGGSTTPGGTGTTVDESGAVVIAQGGPYILQPIVPAQGPSPGTVTVHGGRFLYLGSASYRLEYSVSGVVAGVGQCSVQGNFELSCDVPRAFAAGAVASAVLQVREAVGLLWTPVGQEDGTALVSPYTVSHQAGVPVAMLISQQPGSVRDGWEFGLVPSVTLLDGVGKAITTDSATTVTVSLSQNGQPALGLTNFVEGNSLSTTVAEGVATFSGLGVAKGYAGAGYTLTFTAGAASATSAKFTVWASPAGTTGTGSGTSGTGTDGSGTTTDGSGSEDPPCSLFDSQGACCDTTVDTCGLCGGDGSTCSASASLCITAATADAVDESTFAAEFASAIGLRAERVKVSAVKEDACSDGAVSVIVEVAPPEADNVQDQSSPSMDDLATTVNEQLSDSDSALRSSPSTGAAVMGLPAFLSREGVCGNSKCETGEDSVSCESDCADVAPAGTNGS